MTPDDVRLFDAVVTEALGDSLEALMTKAVAAVARGDFERLQFIDAAVRAAAMLGNAVVAAQSEREKN